MPFGLWFRFVLTFALCTSSSLHVPGLVNGMVDIFLSFLTGCIFSRTIFAVELCLARAPRAAGIRRQGEGGGDADAPPSRTSSEESLNNHHHRGNQVAEPDDDQRRRFENHDRPRVVEHFGGGEHVPGVRGGVHAAAAAPAANSRGASGRQDPLASAMALWGRESGNRV